MSKCIFPPSPTEFWITRWFFGIACSLSFLAYGLYSILSRNSYAVGLARFYGIVFVEVSGLQAALMGMAYIGIALALFSKCYAPYSKRLSGYDEYGGAFGLLVAIIGIGWCSWIFLTE